MAKGGGASKPAGEEWLEGTGIAMAMLDCGPPTEHRSGSVMALLPDGTFHLAVGSTEMGNGSTTSHRQIAADFLGSRADAIAIINADTGISAGDAVITGTDNVVTGTLMGISAVSVLATTSVTLNRSDVTSYVVPMGGVGLFDLTCNWWGDVVGPQNVPEDVAAALFTPFAAGPIANHPEVVCAGGVIGAPRINGALTAPILCLRGSLPDD